VPLADEFDGLLVDLDGVVWIGREPVPGAPETLAALLDAGKEIAFVTNNPSLPPAAYAEQLRAMGVDVGEDRIVTAGMVTARLAAQMAGGRGGALVLGREPLKEMVAAAIGERNHRHATESGGDPPLVEGDAAREAAVVVVSGYRDFDYGHLLAAKRALDAGAALVATSRDPTMPMPGGEWPGSGAVLAAVETASGRRAEIGGKPERHLFEMALAAIGRGATDSGAPTSGPRRQRVAMVGDRLASDIEGGRRAGLATVLVLSGATSQEEAAAADPPPDHVIDNLAALLT
jgi:glycerol-1-phosphatase